MGSVIVSTNGIEKNSACLKMKWKVNVRLFNGGYLRCGFMRCANKSAKPKHIIFNEVIVSGILKPSKLKRYTETRHV